MEMIALISAVNVSGRYGGGCRADDDTVSENKERIKNQIRMISRTWFGSLFFSGSNKWCRVVGPYDYLFLQELRAFGLQDIRGDWHNFNPSSVREGDVIQLIVNTYTPYRYALLVCHPQRGELTI